MFWADQIAQKLKERKLPLEWVDDMKTPSGRIHVGSLRGVVVHDLAYKALLDAGVKAHYTWVFEDHDPMDDIPSYLDKDKYEQYLGMPLFKVPSPEIGFKNYAEYYSLEFQKVFNKLGCNPEILWTSKLYTSGRMNDGIKKVLDNAQAVREIYTELYKKEVARDWYPFQVYCEGCGKVSTSRVYDWDGEKVHYRCPIDAVDWTKGCGHEGKVSPFSDEKGLRGKMPWKVEWAVKWMAIGVTVEGAGKDHMSRGGSHDLASLVCERILKYPVPYPIPYEFLLIGGKKMSSSKGRGFSASGMLDILPPEILRFLMVKTRLNLAINFDPTDPEIIPKLFDEYAEYGQHYFEKVNDDYARVFELSQISPRPPLTASSGAVGQEEVKPLPNIRFSTLTQWIQMPNLVQEIEKEGAKSWVQYAKHWVENFAPEKDRFAVQEILPEETRNLTVKQKEYLGKIAEIVIDATDAEKFQAEIYGLSQSLDLSTKEAFQAIYIALIGKPYGPKAAWLILSLDKKFVSDRFKQASVV